MEPSQHKDVVHNPNSGRTIEKIEELKSQVAALEVQLGSAHDAIAILTNLLAFERKRNANIRD